MFSHTFRKLSKSENIKSFIDNIKFILKQQTTSDLVESYTTKKLDQQRTFQLKLLALKIEKKKYLLEDLHLNNSHFNYMIRDLANSFDSFIPVEINDFLSLYRKGLSIGVNLLTHEQRVSIFENLKQFKHNSLHQLPIRASILHSFSILGIENDHLYDDIDKNSMQNSRASDFLQIFKAMNFNKFYFNEEFFREAERKTPLIMGRLSDLDIFIQCLDQYLLLCEINKISPSSSTLNCYINFFDHVSENNRFGIIKLFLCSKARVLPYLTKYHDEVKKMFKYPPRNYDKFLEFAIIYNKIFPDDLDSKHQLLKALKEKLYLEPTAPSQFRMGILNLMTNSTYDEEIFTYSLKNLINSKENYNCLLLSFSYYLKLTGKSLLDHPLLSPYNYDINKIINNIDLIQLNPILMYIHDNLNTFQDQSNALISLIESNIASKAQRDLYVGAFILNTLKYNCIYSSHQANIQLLRNVQKSLNLSNPPFK